MPIKLNEKYFKNHLNCFFKLFNSVTVLCFLSFTSFARRDIILLLLKILCYCFYIYNSFIYLFFCSKGFKNILQLSNEFTKQNNSKLYFVYLPQHARYIDGNNHDNFSNYKKITEIVKSLEIPIIDINKELFEKHKDPLSLFPFRLGGHYNEKGCQLVAETIFRKIN